MRKWNRAIALLLAALMLPSLAACDAFGTHMARAVQKMSRLDNLHFVLSAELELALSAAAPGKAAAPEPEAAEKDAEAAEKDAETAETPTSRVLPIRAEFSAEGELYTDPLRAAVQSELRLPGGVTKGENYLEKKDGAYYLYSRRNDGTLWQKQGLAEGDRGSVKGLKYIIQGAEGFTESGVEELDGRTAERYDGVIAGEYLAGLLELYRVWSFLAEDFGLRLHEGLFDDPADVPASIWLDRETGMIVRVDVDLTDFADAIADEQLRDSREALGLDAFGLGLELSALRLRADLSAFDEAGEFRIPDEALSAWGESVMPWEK